MTCRTRSSAAAHSPTPAIRSSRPPRSSSVHTLRSCHAAVPTPRMRTAWAARKWRMRGLGAVQGGSGRARRLQLQWGCTGIGRQGLTCSSSSGGQVHRRRLLRTMYVLRTPLRQNPGHERCSAQGQKYDRHDCTCRQELEIDSTVGRAGL